jgi:hypothetical protein
MRAPLGTTYDEMDAGASALASILAPLTGAVLIRQRIIFKSVAVPQDVADVGSSIKRRGVFYFASDDDMSVTLVEVPGILEEMILTTGNGAGVLIDLSNGYISTLIATIIETPICDPFGVLMGHILAAYRQSRTQ